MSDKRDIAILVTLSLTVSLCALSFIVSNDSEKSGMMAWLDDLNGTTSGSYSRAADSVKKVGTNALPQLMSLLTSEDSIVDKEVQMLAESQSMMSLKVEPALDRQWQALKGFEVLGEDAEPVIDRLASLLELGEHSDVVPFALAEIGDAGMDPLQSALTNSSEEVRGNAALALAGIEHSEKLVPSLLRLLKDANASVREAAASALGILAKEEEPEVVPELEKLLEDTDLGVRNAAMRALGLLLRR